MQITDQGLCTSVKNLVSSPTEGDPDNLVREHNIPLGGHHSQDTFLLTSVVWETLIHVRRMFRRHLQLKHSLDHAN